MLEGGAGFSVPEELTCSKPPRSVTSSYTLCDELKRGENAVNLWFFAAAVLSII